MRRSRGRGRRLNLTEQYSPCKRKFHEKWVLYSIWNPSAVQEVLEPAYQCHVNLTRRDLVDILKKTFFVSDEDLQLDDISNKLIVLRVKEFDTTKEGAKFSDKPLEIKCREIKFQKIFEKEPPVTDVSVYCGGSLAEMLNGILSMFDALVIVGHVHFSEKKLHSEKEILYLNDKEENCERLQIIRIPYIEEEVEYPFLLIEKVKLFVREVFTFKYLALDPQTNFKVEKTSRRIFSAEQQCYDMNNPSRRVCDVTNPDFFYMPIHRYMSPTTIFDFLIFPQSTATLCGSRLAAITETEIATNDEKDDLPLNHNDSDEEKIDMKLFTRNSPKMKKPFVAVGKFHIIILMVLIFVALSGLVLLLPLYQCDENINFQKPQRNSELVIIYHWNFMDIVMNWADWMLNYIVGGFRFISSTLKYLDPFSRKYMNSTSNFNDTGHRGSDMLEWMQQHVSSFGNVFFNPGGIISNVLKSMYKYFEMIIKDCEIDLDLHEHE